MSYWVVYRQYETKEALFRAAVEPMFDAISVDLRAGQLGGASVGAAISSCVWQASRTMLSEAYLQMFLLVIREHANQGWLEPLYRETILRTLSARFEAAVRVAGDTHGLVIGVRPGASVRAVRMLESTLVTPRLIPGREPLSDAEIAIARKAACDALMASTYAVDFSEEDGVWGYPLAAGDRDSGTAERTASYLG